MRLLPALAALLLIAGCGQQTASGPDPSAPTAKPVKWDVPTWYTAKMPGIGTTQGWIADQVRLVSDGQIQFNIAEPGKLLKSPKEILDAVSGNEIQAGYGAAVFWQGKMPAAALFTAVPFGPEAPEYLAWMYHGGGMELYQRMYDDKGYKVKVLIAGISTPETAGWFREEIATPADLKGKSMRIAGLGGKVLEQLGMTTIQMPGGEIFQNLDTGKLDAAEYSTPAADASQTFHRIAPYNYFPGWHQQATLFELLINKDEWNTLSKAQQAMIETTCRAAVTESLAYSEALQPAAMKRNVDEHGVKVRYWSDEHLAAFRQAWDTVVSESCAADPFFKEVWDNLSAFRADYALWQQNGFLPRK